jgi:oligosaccharide repeat unit polymerase
VNQHLNPVAKGSLSPGVWWLNPAIAFSIPAVIAGFIAYSTDSTAYLNLWRTAKHFDFSCLQLLLAVALVFTCGCLLGGARRREANLAPAVDWTQTIRWDAVRLLFRISFVLTVVAYIIWYALAIKHGLSLSVILDLLQGRSHSDNDFGGEHLTTIPGVTTATQFGLTVVTLAVPLGIVSGWRTVKWQCLTVFALALTRSFLDQERLAVIELVVPLVVSFLGFRTMSKRLRLLTQFGPVIGGVFLYLGFSLAEYFRSWSRFYAVSESNFWSFMAIRLAGYYTTALNNGALLWKVSQPLSAGLPMNTLGFLWHFPILKNVLATAFPSLSFPEELAETHYGDLLATSANPELNNPSGIFAPFVDYGVAGGLLCWLLAGLICGFLYKEFKRRSVAGIFLYPAIYIGLIEATRILYWASGRFFPDIFVLVVGVLLLFRRPGAPLVCRLSLDPDTTPG